MNFKKLIFIVILLINLMFYNYSYAAELTADSPAAIVFNTNTNQIIYEKNAYTKMYPASTTKIMTAILVIENCNLEDTTKVKADAIFLPSGYTGANLQEGEILTINDLLHLMLIESANDAANVLAEYVGGSISEFANMMNDKAIQIGCTNTHFVNPNGVHNKDHYTTAYDLCLIANYAMKNDVFRQIVSTTSYTVPATNKYNERISINTNKLLHKTNEKTNTNNIYYYEFATGIKTGYTTFANNCLVASAKKDDVEFIIVLLGSKPFETDFDSQRYSDAKNLFMTAFDNYTLSTIKKSGDVITTVEIPNRHFMKKDLDLVLESDLEILINNKDLKSELKYETTLYTDKLQDSIFKGDILGTVTYSYNGTNYTRNLLAANDVITANQLQIVIVVLVILLISIVVIKIKKHKK